MRQGELWDPPPATAEHREYLIELLRDGCRLDVNRISSLVIDQLADSYSVGASHMHGIIDAIKTLEGIGTPTNAKPRALFMHKPLRGLWHFHYLSPLFLPKNVANEFEEQMGGEEAMDRRIVEIARDTTKTDQQKETQLNQLAHKFTVGAYMQRNQEKRMTGEWLVYAKDTAGTNHYLAAALHAGNALNKQLRRLIRARCEPRFVSLLP